MTQYHIKISGQSKEAMADLVRKYKINIFNHGITYSKETGYLVDAMADSKEIQLLEENGYTVKILKNLDEAGKISQKEVGKGNRYMQKFKTQQNISSSSSLSKDLSTNALDSTFSYLNVDEVETALSVASSAPY